MNRRRLAGVAIAFAALGCNPERFVFDQDSSTATSPPPPPCYADSGYADSGSCPVSTVFCDRPVSSPCVACVDDSNCTSAAAPRCDHLLHQCVQCGSQLDCPSGQTCTESLQCITLCLDGGGCPGDTPICFEQLCLGCRFDDDCASSYGERKLCNTMSGKCVQCVSDSQCPDHQRCNVSQGECVECLSKADCLSPTQPACATSGYTGV